MSVMKQMATARRQNYWDLRAAGNFIGGGTGVGLLVAAAVALMMGEGSYMPLFVGMASLSLGLSLVWLEIGKPWRALNVFFHPQTSWMTREGILAGPVLIVGGLAFWFHGLILAILAATLGLGFLYCQARILKASRAIPAWSNKTIVPLILVAGLAEGMGLFLAMSEPSQAFVLAGLALGVLFEAVHQGYLFSLKKRKAPAASLECLTGQMASGVVLARISGLALLAVGSSGYPSAVIAGGVLLTVSGWTFKGLLVTRAAYTRGAAIPFTPTRGRSQAKAVGGF